MSNRLFVLTKDAEVVEVDANAVFPTHPFQYIRLSDRKGIPSTEVEVTGETRESLAQYMKDKNERERLKILMGSTSKLAELNVLTYFKTFLDYILEKEITVDYKYAKKLDGREIFEALKLFIDTTMIELEKETKR